MAGGHSLIPLMRLRLSQPKTVIDIGRIRELRGISVSGGRVTIGPLTTHAQVASSAELRRACPLLPLAASVIGDPAVRNRGTIGGNVVHADPGSDMPTALTALDATFVVVGPGGERSVRVRDFFTGYMQTAVEAADALTSIQVAAAPAQGYGAGYAKMFQPASRYALVNAAATVTVSGGRCTAATVAVGGLVQNPRRCPSAEQVLVGKALSAGVIEEAASKVAYDLGNNVMGDIHASADYRRQVLGVYVQRALTQAAQNAGVR
jgi:carbon-monoxide dehydrogenase medium subunit